MDMIGGQRKDSEDDHSAWAGVAEIARAMLDKVQAGVPAVNKGYDEQVMPSIPPRSRAEIIATWPK
jgi:hypothetical protein